MNKFITIIILTSLTGCSLSKGAHLAVSNQDGKRTDSSCGYFDNSIKFGNENEIFISLDDIVISVCSIDHHSKVVAKGLIIPLYPISDGYEVSKESKWVKLTNSGSEPLAITNLSSLIKVTFKKYPDNDAGTLKDISDIDRNIVPGKYAWVGFTAEAPLSLDVKSASRTVTLNFKNANSYSWYMATH